MLEVVFKLNLQSRIRVSVLGMCMIRFNLVFKIVLRERFHVIFRIWFKLSISFSVKI